MTEIGTNVNRYIFKIFLKGIYVDHSNILEFVNERQIVPKARYSIPAIYPLTVFSSAVHLLCHRLWVTLNILKVYWPATSGDNYLSKSICLQCLMQNVGQQYGPGGAATSHQTAPFGHTTEQTVSISLLRTLRLFRSLYFIHPSYCEKMWMVVVNSREFSLR